MSRLPPVKPLSQILPSGSEGGKEFARIVDLLLFYDARRNNGNVTLFNDRSGDTFGLDAFDSAKSGYQYKFFPSPLTSGHRKEIVEALKKAAAAHDKSNIVKWLLVTPDDLVNSGRKIGGGDVEWFGKLKKLSGANFEIEHVGHTKLQALFLQSDALCLHYYPDIIPSGLSRLVSLQSIRKQFDDNLRRRYNPIEFVGMSVRKEEATRGSPMESIYIPLETVAEGTPDDDNAHRTNPTEFTAPGRRTVILGDPGTGKSTLLRFLALAGISPRLQERYAVQKDDRLSLLVTLRRYADDLKTNKNMPLIDHIVSTIQADFSIPNFSSAFVTHHLETGRAVLFFDGVDELPDLGFKTLVRERVQSLVTSFPGNTVIVTSRIAGYDAEARFSGPCAFDHMQMAPLLEPEIQRFAEDWHAERTKGEHDRKRYVAELMRILTDPENQPIRDLARNPLLLTIMVLVHRIDAVLPDQRVVLYQKCVETLMISWLDRKAGTGSHEKGKGRSDQRQLRRLASIAQWMHEQAGSGGGDRRAVVRKTDLSAMLTRHILDVERWDKGQEKAEDEADEFLLFVRNKAGLLIEVGAELYSFVHLTFQEYLTARHIIIQSEAKGGDDFIWDKLGPMVTDSRWREVIRLLVAERESEESQRALTDQILRAGKGAVSASNGAAIANLGGGLLIDRVPAATEQAVDILDAMVFAVARCADDEVAAPALLSQLTTLLQREENLAVWDLVVEQSLGRAQADRELRASIVLTAFALPLPPEQVTPLMNLLAQDDAQTAALSDGFLWGTPMIASQGQALVQRLYDAVPFYALKAPGTNLTASVLAGSLPGQNRKLIARILILALATRGPDGPFNDFTLNCLSLHAWSPASATGPIHPEWDSDRVLEWFRDLHRDLGEVRHRGRLRVQVRDLVLARDHDLGSDFRLDLDRDPDMGRALGSVLNRDRYLARVRDRVQEQRRSRVGGRRRTPSFQFWSMLAEERAVQDAIIDAVIVPLNIQRIPIWREALRRRFLPTLRDRHTVFRPETLAIINADLTAMRFGEDVVWGAVCWLILDLGVNLPPYLEAKGRADLAELILLSESTNHPTLAFARDLRRAVLGIDAEGAKVNGKGRFPSRVLSTLFKDDSGKL